MLIEIFLHLGLFYIYCADAVIGSDYIPGSGYKRVAFVVGTGTGKFAAGGVCQVCNGSGVGETDKFL